MARGLHLFLDCPVIERGKLDPSKLTNILQRNGK
jgi:hypothetical protein